MKKLILASGSPRRKEILEKLGLHFDVLISDTDESTVDKTGLPVNIYVQELALLKANASAAAIDEKDALIISADTVVSLDGEILGKPKNEDDAFAMLKKLSGRSHSVFTGVCVMRKRDMLGVCKSVETKVVFKELTDETIKRYIATGEPADKAGAYGIQGKGALLVNRIEGDYYNVVGLPVSCLADILEKEFDFDVLKESK